MPEINVTNLFNLTVEQKKKAAFIFIGIGIMLLINVMYEEGSEHDVEK